MSFARSHHFPSFLNFSPLSRAFRRLTFPVTAPSNTNRQSLRIATKAHLIGLSLDEPPPVSSFIDTDPSEEEGDETPVFVEDECLSTSNEAHVKRTTTKSKQPRKMRTVDRLFGQGDSPSTLQFTQSRNWFHRRETDLENDPKVLYYIGKKGDGKKNQPRTELLAATEWVHEMVQAKFPNATDFHEHKTPLVPSVIPELKGRQPSREIRYLINREVKREISAMEKSSSGHILNPALGTFDPRKTGWYNKDSGKISGNIDPHCLGAIKDLMHTQIPQFPSDLDEFEKRPFLLFAVLFPYPVMVDMFAHSNPSLLANGSDVVLSADQIFKSMIFMAERGGDVFEWGSLRDSKRSGIISSRQYVKNMSAMSLNVHTTRAAEIMGGAEAKTAQMQQAANNNTEAEDGQMPPDLQPNAIAETTFAIMVVCGGFNRHMCSVFTKKSILVLDEVSIPWTGDEQIHIVRCKTKVHRLAVEVKVVNLAGWGVRIAMFPVCNKATNVIIITTTCAEGTDQIPDPSTPLSAWYVVRLLWEAGFLRNSEEKPDLLIADGAFISVSLVAYLKARYNIVILGPVKVCSAWSIKALAYELQLPDQQGLVARTWVESALPDMVAPWREPGSDFVSPSGTELPRGARGRFSSTVVSEPLGLTKGSKGGSRAKVVQTNTKSTPNYHTWVYQFVDGVQTIATSLPCLQLHHHISHAGLDWVRDKDKLMELISPGTLVPAGFHASTARYLYRVLFNACDVQNRSLRKFGCMSNHTTLFSRKFFQYLVDLTFDNAHRVWCRLTGRDVTTNEFKAMVISDAYCEYQQPDGAAVASSEVALSRHRFGTITFDNDLMRRLGCSDLQLFREDKPGLHERRLHRSSAPRLCSVCIKRASRSEQILADFGCLGCAKTLPNQLFCAPCWYSHFSTHHTTQRRVGAKSQP